MKKYLKILAAAILILLFAVISYSQAPSNAAKNDQPKKTVEQRTKSMVDEMTKVATLSTEEISKITPFVTEFQKQKDADEESSKGNKDKLSTSRKVRMDKLSAQVKGILTPEQYNKLQDYWKNKRNSAPNTQATQKNSKTN